MHWELGWGGSVPRGLLPPSPPPWPMGPWSVAVRTVACAGKEQACGVCHHVQPPLRPVLGPWAQAVFPRHRQHG